MSEERGGRPTRVDSLVERVLRGRGVLEGVERASVVPHWEELVGAEIARVAKPVGFAGGTLFVEVRSSAWLMELRMLERQMLERLNAGRRYAFDRIVFRQGSRRRDRPEG